MEPTGNTNQGIGMAWAWMSLTQSDPLNAPAKDPNYTYKDAIILLSDGLNTQNRWYSNASQIDARQKILCDNAKAAGITVYTIQVNTGAGRSDLRRAAILRERPQNFYIDYVGEPDRCRVQLDRDVALETARRQISPRTRIKKSPAATGRAFCFREPC